MKFMKWIVVILLITSLTSPGVTFAEEGEITDQNENKAHLEPAAVNDELSEIKDDSSGSFEESEKVEVEEKDTSTETEGEAEVKTNEVEKEDSIKYITENEPEKELKQPEKEESTTEFEEQEIAEPMPVSKSIQVANIKESKTSRLGHLNSSSVRIYKDVENQSAYTQAGSENTNEVYYIKLQTVYNNSTYYLLSRNSSSTTGVLGWVKSTDTHTFEHRTVDKNAKTLYIKGSGSAYTKAWGGRKNYSFEKLSTLKGQEFAVNLTETVGKDVWYRGKINGKTAWILEGHLSVAPESKTSRLGHLNSSSVRIYKDVENQSAYTQAGSKNTNEVYYIKLQTVYNNSTYYLLSRNSSSTTGVLGWVKSTDMHTFEHRTVDKNAKTLYIKGSGSAYTKAWGGRKNYSFEKLSTLKGQEFAVNLTETVGKDVWYRGKINGKTAWIQEGHLSVATESKTSRLGHLNSSSVRIYKDVENQSAYTQAGSENTNEVYYIKLQTVYNNSTYYLLSRNSSSTTGVLGWVKSTDTHTFEHRTVDKNAETLYIKGSGSAYTKAWGGRKNYSFEKLSTLKGQEFAVNLTETVGKDVWYRGKINGKTAWIQEGHVSVAKESRTSRLGHIKNGAVLIYKDYDNQKESVQAGSANTNQVYYIKQQVTYKDELYYLISQNPSSESGVVGWVKATDLDSQPHVGVDKTAKTYYIKGSNAAYTKAWGGSKNINVANLASLKGEEFKINLTEKVGNTIWYRGVLNGKTAWISSAYVSTAPIETEETILTNYNVTLNQAHDIQMKQLQQTDKYRNDHAYIHNDNVDSFSNE